MRRVLKWIGIVLGVLVGVIVVAVIALNFIGNSRMNRTHDITVPAVEVPSDEASIARGEQWVTAVCADCHGENLAGYPFIEEEGIVTVYSANITPGEGGVGDHSDEDLVRAIRHAVDTDGRQLMVMPAEVFIHWGEEDLGAAIAYLRTVEPVDSVNPPPESSLMARVLLGLDMFGAIFPAEYIDHEKPLESRPEIGVNEAYGEYLVDAVACALCHGENLSGAFDPPPNVPPDMVFPPIPNLTMGGRLADWSEEEFIAAVTTGVRPDGNNFDNEIMPLEMYAGLEDDEMRAIWLYLQSLPPREFAE